MRPKKKVLCVVHFIKRKKKEIWLIDGYSMNGKIK